MDTTTRPGGLYICTLETMYLGYIHVALPGSMLLLLLLLLVNYRASSDEHAFGMWSMLLKNAKGLQMLLVTVPVVLSRRKDRDIERCRSRRRKSGAGSRCG